MPPKNCDLEAQDTMSKLGMLGSFIDQSYPPASKFTEDDVPDLSGKIIIVTGGNTGIGV